MKDKKTFFVTGIGTDVGKTIVSAILVEALEADYWKPVQSGDLDHTDSDKIKALISNLKTKFHPETYQLNTPASPHYSAELDGVEINLNDFNLPETDNHLIIEGAGGLMVPINENETIFDLIKKLNIPVILVASYYLGSINHTLLSIDKLLDNHIKIDALIFSGEVNISTRDIIIKKSKGINKIIEIPQLNIINKKHIKQIAESINI